MVHRLHNSGPIDGQRNGPTKSLVFEPTSFFARKHLISRIEIEPKTLRNHAGPHVEKTYLGITSILQAREILGQ